MSNVKIESCGMTIESITDGRGVMSCIDKNIYFVDSAVVCYLTAKGWKCKKPSEAKPPALYYVIAHEGYYVAYDRFGLQFTNDRKFSTRFATHNGAQLEMKTLRKNGTDGQLRIVAVRRKVK